MKKFNLLLLIMTVVVFTNCSKEQVNETETNSDLNFTINVPITDQKPHLDFDQSEKGLYHGIIASGVKQTRGKIWINIANDTQFNAYVEMVNGDKISYELADQTGVAKSNIFTFTGERGAFTINLNNYNEPVISNAILNNEAVFAKVVKGTNGRMPFSYTGTFTDNGSFNGTWNLISTGVMAPEGWGYELIDSAVVTFNGNMYSHSSFNTFNYPCVSLPNMHAQMGDLPGNANAVISHSQTSNFGGVTTWDLATGNGQYTNDTCNLVTSGTFTWTNSGNGNMKNGFIYID